MSSSRAADPRPSRAAPVPIGRRDVVGGAGVISRARLRARGPEPQPEPGPRGPFPLSTRQPRTTRPPPRRRRRQISRRRPPFSSSLSVRRSLSPTHREIGRLSPTGPKRKAQAHTRLRRYLFGPVVGGRVALAYSPHPHHACVLTPAGETYAHTHAVSPQGPPGEHGECARTVYNAAYPRMRRAITSTHTCRPVTSPSNSPAVGCGYPRTRGRGSGNDEPEREEMVVRRKRGLGYNGQIPWGLEARLVRGLNKRTQPIKSNK